MALLTIASAKGSPGTTTLALVLGAVWPRQVVLADCDPVGGDVSLRIPSVGGGRLSPDRGLVSLAAAGRHGLAPGPLDAHLQRLAGGLAVLAGVTTPEQARAMGPLWRELGPHLDTRPGTDVIADVGRLATSDPGDAAVALMRSSRLVVLVCRPEVSSVFHLRERLGALREVLRPRDIDGVPIQVAVVAPEKERRAVDGVRDVLARHHPEVTVAGLLPYDPRGAAFFAGQVVGRVERSLLLRGGRELAARFAAALAPFWVDQREDQPRGAIPPPGVTFAAASQLPSPGRVRALRPPETAR